MSYRLRHGFLFLLGLVVIVSTVVHGQQPVVAANEPSAVATPLPQRELDALVAPIALYPDDLLAQVLMASTYPLEIVMAARFVQQNPSLTGDALDQALRDQNWDPSVISLTAYPQVLVMMNDKLDWTQRLGDAFLANEQQVMDTVQALRSRAQAAGNLQSTPQQTVMDQGGFIDIEPAQPEYVYVPVYDPRVIYGPWPDPVYQPDYWYPPPIYGYPDLSAGIAVGLFFGAACRISHNHWGWAHANWRRHDIDVDIRNNNFANRPQYINRWRDGQWAHSPEHRHGIAYRDNGSRDRFVRSDAAAIQAREPYRGRDLGTPQQVGSRPVPPPQQGMVRPAPQQQSFARPVPPPQQGMVRPAPQQQPFARPAPQPQQEMLHPAQQAQPFARAMPPPQQVMARPAPQFQPMTRPMPQQYAPQPAYFPQQRAQVQMDSNRGQMSRQTNTAPSAPQRGGPR
ncbi:MAG TPA: DUF3300 domain-containing protein [Casimicrobiaceae bacterium]|jgi:hypothetical protein|nr:DUF3300 domain-containing protein [Casimicrobiaceae bacterium]